MPPGGAPGRLARPGRTRPTRTASPASASSTASAPAPVTPSTGTPTRPAGMAGSGRSPGRASSTARAPAAAAAAAWADGLAPAATTTRRSVIRSPPPREQGLGVGGAHGPGGPQAAIRGRRAAEQRGVELEAAQLELGVPGGARLGQRAGGERGAGRAGRADRARRRLGGALVARGRDDQRAERGRAPDGARLGALGEAGVGRVDPDDGDARAVVAGAVAVGIHGALEPGQQPVGGGQVLGAGRRRRRPAGRRRGWAGRARRRPRAARPARCRCAPAARAARGRRRARGRVSRSTAS